MSDHPEVPRVEFNDNGESLNVEQAVAKFREILRHGKGHYDFGMKGEYHIKLNIVMRPCDCDSALDGRDEYCPLHGDKS